MPDLKTVKLENSAVLLLENSSVLIIKIIKLGTAIQDPKLQRLNDD